MFIRWYKDLTIKDIPIVGGKNASLGEMYRELKKSGILVPNGFAITADFYREFLKYNNLDKKIKIILKDLDVKNVRALSLAGGKVRRLILSGQMSGEMKREIGEAYKKLSKENGNDRTAVAVRSSATAEDLPDASFAGQQETYLNVRGEKALLEAVRKCLASLFTDRAISYREAKGYDHFAVALSIGVQKMVRSDVGSAGVMFTLDTESGFRGVVLINAAYGLGEYVVKGQVTPDQFYVFKEGVNKGLKSIISRRLGSKEVKLVYASQGGTKQEKVKVAEQQRYCLSDDDVVQLSKWGMVIEKHYNRPMDIEWVKDGVDGKLYIVQARSETVKSRADIKTIETYHLKKRGVVAVSGVSVGQKIGTGKVRVINSAKQMKSFKAGEVLVARITDPDWEPIMRLASAVVTEQGGKTSHAAIVSRELGLPCIVGANGARKALKQGAEVTVSCAEGEVGYVYSGRLPFEVEKHEIKKIPETKTKIMMNLGNPDAAFSLSAIPSHGVGLAREEFIFTNFIKIHPLALVNYNNLQDKKAKEKIKKLTVGYKDKTQYGIDKLAEGFAFIAAAFHPHDVIVRLSDFKTNEYATLIGGAEFEPKEENPMIGWRGASRYYDPKYKEGFRLECAAIKKAREEWGLKNIIVMVPFCRTVEEGEKVLVTMKEFGLERGKDGLQVYVMCEIPSNVILAKEFAKIFDGFSIGSNDLTQLTLGVDRDSALVSHVYDENNLAVKTLIRQVIHAAHAAGRKVGICGQAPSDYPEFAEFLVQEGIDSISLNPDTVLKTRTRIAEAEKKLGKNNGSFKSVMASKMLLVMGVIGLGLVLAGSTCQVINYQQQIEDTKKAVTAELIQFKEEMRMEAERIEAARKVEYTESGFADFTIQYPAKWKMEHKTEAMSFLAPDNTGYLDITLMAAPKIPAKDTAVTSTWFNYPTRQLEVDGTTTTPTTTVLYVYPTTYKKSREVIRIRGDALQFNEYLKYFTEFKI